MIGDLLQKRGSMSIEIDEVIIKRTIKCQKDKACLNGEECYDCKFESPISDELIFVKPKQKNTECPYKLLFGYDSHICQCPVRCEIYRKYGR